MNVAGAVVEGLGQQGVNLLLVAVALGAARVGALAAKSAFLRNIR
jgi:hypothetical protein